MEIDKIRNFCIIAHIDHGKSTLADRFLELTNTVPKEKMRSQYLDQMELEKERGITIKLQPVRMKWKGYELNLIDTPGHVDFTYEVSRSLKSVEGAILLVDSTQGIEAQTISNLRLALSQDLKIIPAVNKIDMPHAGIEETVKSIAKLLKIQESEVARVSAKTGQNVDKLLDEVIKRVPAPVQCDDPKRALIFDSQFDDFRGVVVFVRVFGGEFTRGDRVLFISTNTEANVIEVGSFKPEKNREEKLQDGQIGYLITTLKNSGMCRVGDTVTDPINPGEALPGYREVKPMVYAGLFAAQENFEKLKTSMEKLSLSDPSIRFESENSPSLGYGFRVGFLGLLHMEIIIERLSREFSVSPIITPPSVSYLVNTKTGDRTESIIIKSPMEMPSPDKIISVEEPWLEAQIVTAQEYIGPIMSLLKNTRAKYEDTVYLSQDRIIIKYQMPLTLMLKGFYDKLKSVSKGYASLNYDLAGWVSAKLEKLDILAGGIKIPELSQLVYPEEAYSTGRRIVETLKEEIPPQQFEIKLQAAIGSKILASETKKALRKDVTAKLYGGDVTRKMKLLKKQKQGKKKMAHSGRVEIPTKAYLAVYRKA